MTLKKNSAISNINNLKKLIMKKIFLCLALVLMCGQSKAWYLHKTPCGVYVNTVSKENFPGSEAEYKDYLNELDKEFCDGDKPKPITPVGPEKPAV